MYWRWINWLTGMILQITRAGRGGQTGLSWRGAATQPWGKPLGISWPELPPCSRSTAGWTGHPNMVEIDSSEREGGTASTVCWTVLANGTHLWLRRLTILKLLILQKSHILFRRHVLCHSGISLFPESLRYDCKYTCFDAMLLNQY